MAHARGTTALTTGPMALLFVAVFFTTGNAALLQRSLEQQLTLHLKRCRLQDFSTLRHSAADRQPLE